MSGAKNSEERAARAPAVRLMAGRLPGVLALSVALVASAALSLQHLAVVALPGCGLESACERVSRSAWGRVPGIDWPTAHLGAAFFAGLFVAWIVGRGRLAAPVRAVVGLGVLASLVLLGVMAVERSLCPWCVAAHGGNLLFAALVWRRPSEAARRSSVSFASVFLLVTALLAVPEQRQRAELRTRSELALAESLERMKDGGADEAFAGRWRRGPELAPIRIVLFTDYQCPDCRVMETQVEEVTRRWPEISVSVKHFPFCSECNRRLRTARKNPHPNACRAARAAEAAGLVGGAEGFWSMHRWLFARGGKFTDAELRAGLGTLGLEEAAFLHELDGPTTEASVAADIEEGIALGLYVTPLIFLNGEELRGWNAELALVRAVEELMAAEPSATSAAADRPASGLERLVDEWRRTRRRRVPETPEDRWLMGDGREDSIEVIVWGDYLDPPTRELDRRIRAVAADQPRVRYAFRLFPLDAGCNSAAQTRYAGACAVALASAASLFEGTAAHLRLHERLMAGAPAPRVEHPGASEALRADIEAARRLRVHSVPLWFVDGRPVHRWRLEGQPVVERILEEALGE